MLKTLLRLRTPDETQRPNTAERAKLQRILAANAYLAHAYGRHLPKDGG